VLARLARFHTLRAGTARGPQAPDRDRSPVAAFRLARGGLGVLARFARFHALRAGTARGPQVSDRDRSPVAALGLAREGWDLHHTMFLSTRCAPGRRAVRRRSGRDWSPVAALRLARGGMGFLARWLPLFALVWLSLAFPAFGSESVDSLQPIITTNYIVVTNMVLVTNYPARPTAGNVIFGPTNSALPDLSWVPPDDRYDWIQLKSGEWLKGQLKAMQERTLEFYSDELDDLTFNWKDIRQVRSPHTIDVLSMDGRHFSGPVNVTPDQVIVAGSETNTLPRDQIQSLTPGGSRRDYWSGKVSLGLNLQSGNSKQVDYNASLDLQRRTPDTRLSLDYLGNINRIDGVDSANNHRINSEFDYWFSHRFYLILPNVEYYKDPFQNLADRLTVGGGLGFDLIDRPNLEWNITTGPAYQEAWFDSTQPGEPSDKGTAALAFGSKFKWDISRRIKWQVQYRGQYTSREVGETTHHAVSTLSLKMTKRFDLDVSVVWDRISDPKIGANGVQPQPDDFRFIVGLGVDF